jgi:hypothetical protein
MLFSAINAGTYTALPGMHPSAVLSRIVTLMHDPAALDDDQLSGNEITIGAG